MLDDFHGTVRQGTSPLCSDIAGGTGSALRALLPSVHSTATRRVSPSTFSDGNFGGQDHAHLSVGNFAPTSRDRDGNPRLSGEYIVRVTSEEKNAAPSLRAAIPGGAARTSGHAFDIKQYFGGPEDAGTSHPGAASAATGSAGVVVGAGQRPGRLRERLQHIEDIIADALWDHETGNLSHRRQAEAVLAVLLARGLNTEALDLS